MSHSKFVLFCLPLILVSALLLWEQVSSVGIRPFGTSSTNCPANVPTALTKITCPCANVGKPCKCAGAICIGPGGSLVGNVGTGSTKLGVCGCLPGSFHNATIDQCVRNLTISIPSPGVISACAFLNDTVTTSSGANLTVAIGGGVRPIQYIIGVFNSTITGTASTAQTQLFATTPLIAIDQNTGQVYATYAPNTAVTQCYQVVAIDANSQVSAPSVFCVATAAYSVACTCGTVTTTAAPLNACTCPKDF